MSRGRTYIDRLSSCQFESGPHLYRSVIIVSVLVGAAPISIDHLLIMSVQFLGPHLYRSAIFLSISGTTPISIGHLSCQFESGPHLYQSAISLSCQSVSGTAPISIGHYCVSLSRDRTYIDRLLSCQFESGPHPYQSVIFLSVSRTAPISIGHLSCQFESGPHLYRSAVSLSCQSVSGTTPISIGRYRVSLSRGSTYINRPSSCQFLGPHLYRSVIFRV